MDIEKSVEKAVKWIQQNRERFWAITGTVVLSVMLVVLLVSRKQKETEEAWLQLGTVQSQLSQGQIDQARKGLDEWKARFSGSDAASYAKFLQADLAYRTSDYAQASQIYGDLAATGTPALVRPLAFSGQISSEEMLGKWKEAQTMAEAFLNKYPDHFLTASMYMTQARLSELTGNPAAAATIYERFVLLYPQSPWTAFAKTRAQVLSKK